MIVTFETERVCLPYCIQALGDGRYILLNRYYKPLGVPNGEISIWENHPVHVEIQSLTPELATMLSVRESPSVDRIYLYNDFNAPWRSKKLHKAYERRLALLFESGIRYVASNSLADPPLCDRESFKREACRYDA